MRTLKDVDAARGAPTPGRVKEVDVAGKGSFTGNHHGNAVELKEVGSDGTGSGIVGKAEGRGGTEGRKGVEDVSAGRRNANAKEEEWTGERKESA